MSEEKTEPEAKPEKENNTTVLLAVLGVCVAGIVMVLILKDGSGGSSFRSDDTAYTPERRSEPPAARALPRDLQIQERPRLAAQPPPPPAPPPAEPTPSVEDQELAEAYEKGRRLGAATRKVIDTVDNAEQEEKQRKAAGQENILRDLKNFYDVGTAIGEFAKAIDDLDTAASSGPKTIFVPNGWHVAQGRKKVNESEFFVGALMANGSTDSVMAVHAFRLNQDPLTSVQNVLAAEKNTKPLGPPERDNDARGAFVRLGSDQGVGVIYAFHDREWTYAIFTAWAAADSERGDGALGSLLQGMFGNS